MLLVDAGVDGSHATASTPRSSHPTTNIATRRGSSTSAAATCGRRTASRWPRCAPAARWRCPSGCRCGCARSAAIRRTGFGACRAVAEGPAGADPFGLDDLDVADLKARPGTKWSRAGGRLAAWVADMDFPIAPAVRDRLIELARTDVGYPDWPAIGRSALPERFAERMATRFGWAPAVDRLHEIGDVMQGVSVAIHHLTRPGDGIVLHMPAYHPFLETIAAAGRRIVPVPAELVGGAWRFDHDELAARLRERGRDAARLLLLCHPHNPTRPRVHPGRARTARRDRRPVTTSPSSATRSTPSSSIRPTATSRSPPSATRPRRGPSPSRRRRRRSTSPGCGGRSCTPVTMSCSRRWTRSPRTTSARRT